MRLKLSVQRHSLPTVHVIWTLSDSRPECRRTTVAQFLEEVNEIIPLESDSWGLEDYVLEIAGFECIHYAPVLDTLKDGDHITIRPLDRTEFRLRVTSGRDQINANGVHLIDGIPFGKQFLRKLSRPAILIPARKRLRSSDASSSTACLETTDAPSRLQMSNTVPAKRRLDTVRQKPVITRQAAKLLQDASENTAEDMSQRSRKRKRKRVRFSEEETEIAETTVLALTQENVGGLLDPSESDSDEDEYRPPSDGSLSDDGSASEETGTSESDDDMSDSSSAVSTSSSEPSSDESSESENDEDEVPKSSATSFVCAARVRKEDKLVTLQPPAAISNEDTRKLENTEHGQGLRSTQARNKRRKIYKKLKSLKSQGILAEDARFEDVEAWLQANRDKTDYEMESTTDKAADNRHKKVPAMKQGDEGRPASEEFVAARVQLLNALANGGINVELPFKQQGPDATFTDTSVTQSVTTQSPGQVTADVAATSPGKQTTLNLVGSRRMLFSSLGFRPPKTKADEDIIRAKLEDSAKRKPLIKAPVQDRNDIKDKEAEQSATTEDFASVIGNSATTPPADSMADIRSGDDDAWKEKIVLSAVECYKEGVRLSTPPFPFVQCWDTQTRALGRERKHKRHGRQRYTPDTNGDLEHGEADGTEVSTEVQQPPAYSNGYDDRDASGDEGCHPNGDVNGTDLPALPADVSMLPPAEAAHLVPGAVIAFKRLEFSEESRWQPVISGYRTAVVDEVHDSSGTGPMVRATLAIRDRPKKTIQYDEDGRRLYAKFEMEDFTDNEDEADGPRESADGEMEAQVAELLDLKILRSAPC